MNPTKARALGTMGRLAGALLAAAGLALGVGVHGATADEPLDPPKLVKFEYTDENLLRVFWADLDVEGGVDGFRMNVYRDEGPLYSTLVGAEFRAGNVQRIPEVPLEPDTRYCTGLQAYRLSDDRITVAARSAESERLCATTPPPPPDLYLLAVRGREEVEWARVRGQGAAYLIEFGNQGLAATGTVVVEIQTSGVATLGEQPAFVRQGWEAAGFTCAPVPVSGGATAGLLCTGGSLAREQRVAPAVIVQFTNPGFGAIHASINVSSGRADADPGDNRLTLPIRIL